MIVLNAHSQQQGRRTMPIRAVMLGLTIGLLSALSAVNAATPAPAPAAQAGQQAPAVSAITDIDFKRGDGGSGKLILRFDRDGAMPDMRSTEAGVIVDIGNARLPAHLQRSLNVTDFATPVQQVQALAQGEDKTQLVLSTSGAFESLAYQTGKDYIIELVPRAAASNRAVGSATAVAAAAQKAPTVAATGGGRGYAGRAVTFNFQDIPVRTVLQLIAEESGLNIVASDTTQGNVTLRLINVPWDQALDLVLQAKQLDKRRSGNVIWVAPQAEIAKFEQDKEDARIAIENRAETVTEYIPVSYGNAEDIAKLLDRVELPVDRMTSTFRNLAAFDFETIPDIVRTLRGHGLRIALGGIAGEPPPLDLIRTVAPDLVRIDGLWFRRVAESEGASRLLPRLVEGFQADGAQVLIEGIETRRQLSAALDAGADLYQGFLLSAPQLAGTATDAAEIEFSEMFAGEAKVIPLFGGRR